LKDVLKLMPRYGDVRTLEDKLDRRRLNRNEHFEELYKKYL